MNLRERLKLRTNINFLISVLEKLVNIILRLCPNKKDIPVPLVKPEEKKRPIKKVIDKINNIIPLPWRKK